MMRASSWQIGVSIHKNISSKLTDWYGLVNSVKCYINKIVVNAIIHDVILNATATALNLPSLPIPESKTN